ncbi:MAG: pentapeptide repeat-containing protein [Candidatus Nanopelagicales bacterium]
MAPGPRLPRRSGSGPQRCGPARPEARRLRPARDRAERGQPRRRGPARCGPHVPRSGSGVSLVGADLRGATLTSADLSSSDLSRANLTGAAGLPSTVTTKVRWTGTVRPDGRGAPRRHLPVGALDSEPRRRRPGRTGLHDVAPPRWSATDDGVVAGVRYRLTRSPAGSTRITAVSISTWLPATRTSIAPVGAPASRYCWQVQGFVTAPVA